MRSVDAAVVEERIHGKFPEAGKLGLALAQAIDRQTVVRHAVIERVRPKRVRVIVSDGNGGTGRRVVSEAEASEHFERVDGVVEERSAEALNGLERDAGKLVQGD